MDSCSETSLSSRWSKSSGSHTKGDMYQVHQMKHQIDSLMQLNTQLSSNLDSVNTQLRQALVNASKVDGLHDEIHTLNQKIYEMNADSKKAKAKYVEEIDDLQTQLFDLKRKYTSEVESLTKAVSKATQEKTELLAQVDVLASELSDAQSQLKASSDRVSHLTRARSKLNQQNKELNSELVTKIKEIEDAANANDEFDIVNKDLTKQCECFKKEIEKYKLQNCELASKLTHLESRAHSAEETLEQIQEQYRRQSRDFTDLNEERNRLREEVADFSGKVNTLSSQLEASQNENKHLVAKVKKLSALSPCHFGDVLDVKALSIPFEDGVREKVCTILNYEHFQPTQKVQLCLNELAKEFSAISSHASTLSEANIEIRKNYEDITHKFHKIEEILSSLLSQWKNFEFTYEQISNIAFCTDDEKFLELIGRDGVNCKALVDSANLLGSLFVPVDLFSEEAEERRKEIIKRVAIEDKELAALISAMFLITTRLQKQVKELIAGATTKDDIVKALQGVDCDDIKSVPTYFQELLNQIAHLKDTRKDIHKSLRAARDEIAKKDKERLELRDQLKSLQEQIATLVEDNANLNTELKLAQNEIIIKQTEVTQAVANLTDNEIVELKRKNKALQKTVMDLTEENATIKRELEEIKTSAVAQTETAVKTVQHKEAEYGAVLRAKEDELKQLKDKLEKTKKKARTMIKDLKTQHEEEMVHVTSELDTQKATFAESLEAMKNKCHKSKDVTKQLSESLAESEQRNQDLTAENVRLSKELKETKTLLSSFEEKCNRFQQDAKADLATQLLSQENKYQRENAELKARLISEKQQFADHIKAKLGSLYGLTSDFDLDDSSLDQLFYRLDSDLKKLRFFQQEATRV